MAAPAVSADKFGGNDAAGAAPGAAPRPLFSEITASPFAEACLLCGTPASLLPRKACMPRSAMPRSGMCLVCMRLLKTPSAAGLSPSLAVLHFFTSITTLPHLRGGADGAPAVLVPIERRSIVGVSVRSIPPPSTAGRTCAAGDSSSNSAAKQNALHAFLGLPASAPELIALRPTPPRFAVVTLRHAHGRVVKPSGSGDKQSGLRPSLVCPHPLRS